MDGHSLAFRSFYAFSKGGEGGLATKDGVPTSVTYGFLKALLDNCKSLTPQGVAIAFDTAEPTFRRKADPNYKAHRDAAESFSRTSTNFRRSCASSCNCLSAWHPALRLMTCWAPWPASRECRLACASSAVTATSSSWWMTAATSL